MGEITSILARRVGLFPPRIKDANVIIDIAVHDIDVFNYLLRPLTSPDGSVIGMIGVAYDKSPWVSSASIGWILGVLLAVIGLCTYWLALPWWVLLDARERGEKAWAWAIFVFIGNFVALIAYILAHSFQYESTV